ncbi:Z-ring formation inhibitor MciZ [Paenibacillus sp. 1P07SE]|uniref:Z-ring formation inhibitor MciZ n=1 Tax=Paenibacillus sp. 1P07SE TaxID=3132209 RepID=UPI0039A6ABE9
MKREMSERQLRMVGKAWEIRHTLRQLARSGGAGATLQGYLQHDSRTVRVSKIKKK